MKWEQKILRAGAIAITLAVLLRLAGGGVLSNAVEFLTKPETGALLLLMETGRVAYKPPPVQNTVPDPTIETNSPTEPTQPEKIQAVFSAADADPVYLKNYTSYPIDKAQLLQSPLDWDLTEDGPAVLIIHTHTTESYENTEGYQQSSNYRTHDENYNMVSIGAHLAQLLEAAGIGVIHDKTIHDYPSFNGAYDNSRASAQKYLQEYPSIRLVLDLHRDAFTDGNGKYLGTSVTVNGEKVARMMLVLGSDGGGLTHPNWKENTTLAIKLYAQLEKLCPGICRNLSLTNQRYNQDLCTGALLFEMGAAGNTRQEALRAAEYLAQAIIDLAYGTKGY